MSRPWLALSLALLAGAYLLSLRAPASAAPLELVQLGGAHAMEDLGFIALGMRRQAADLHFIRLLQYYGTSEHQEEGHHHHGHGHAHGESDLDQGRGEYPEFVPRTLRILELDPYYRYATLYTAGALAFNMNKQEEAVALLRKALERDPKAFRNHLYIAAIAYKKHQELGKLVDVLEPAMSDPECPAMLKLIVAGIYNKLGRPEKAVDLYRQIEQDSRDPDSRRLARERREKLQK